MASADRLASDEIALMIPEDRPDLSGTSSDEEGSNTFFTPRARITYSRFNSPIAGPLARVTVSPDQAEVATFNEEMARVHNKADLRAKIDTAVLKFNTDPDEAFAYMKRANLGETPRAQAHFLLITLGLDKGMIGQVLGGHKPMHVAILQAYVDITDFSKLEFDVALRCFLSRFRLPGEAQKIDRIVNAFAQRYYLDNPSMFPNSDTPYILAFSLIMLNTDYHSPKIPVNRKMTKEQFVRNNREVLATLPKQYLEDMYDRITANQLETKSERLEDIYKGLIAVSDNIRSNHMSPAKRKDLIKSAMSAQELLRSGVTFMKYPRKGQARPRFFFFSEEFDRFQWRNDANSRDRPRFILVGDLSDVLSGTATDNFKRFRVQNHTEKLCFSLITPRRSLDLQAKDGNSLSTWLLFFREKVRENVRESRRFHGKNDKSEEFEIAWDAILERWQRHWDSETARPMMSQEAVTTSCSCFRSRDAGQSHSSLTNDGYYLVTMWRRGVPDSKRSIVWQAAIGDSLKLTKELYRLRCQEANSSDSIQRIGNAVEQVRKDIHQFAFLGQKIGQNWDSLVETTIKALLLHRADIEFTPSLISLAAEFLYFLPDYESFVCLTNLVHKYYFPALLSNFREQVQIRVQFFDQMFTRELRSLRDHFRSLSIESEFFLLEWLATLFTKVLPIPIVSHVWDVIFLDGEVYAVKVAVGILKYFEKDLRMMSFEGIMRTLHEVTVNVNEEDFFEGVDSIQVDSENFERQLRQVSAAGEKSRVLATLINSR